MRFLFVLLVFCFSFINLFSQWKSKSKGDETIQVNYVDLISSVMAYSSSGTESKYTYTYDSNGKLLTLLKEDLIDGQWSVSRQVTYTNDVNGNRLTFLSQQWLNGQWENLYQGNYTYDLNNNLLTALVEQWLISEWVKYSYNENTYNADGKTLTTVNENYQNGVLSRTSKYTYTYNNESDILTNLYELWQNGQLTNSNFRIWTYNSDGNPLTYVYQVLQDGQLVNSLRYNYTYDSNKRIVEQAWDKWDNNNWVASEKYSYNRTFINDTILTTYILLYEVYENGEWIYSDRNTYNYNSNGKQISELAEKWLDSSWTNYYRNAYTYTNDGKYLTTIGDEWINGEWVMTGKTTYDYDEKGNNILYQNEYYDNGQLQDNSYKLNYLYNNSGNIKSESFETVSGGEWINYNNNFQVSDSNGNQFGFSGVYKIDITYQSEVGVAEEINKLLSLDCFPNPASVQTKINYSVSMAVILTIDITNENGVMISRLENNKYHEPGNYTLNYNTENLPSGAYYITINNKNNIESRAFVIVK
ncbi:MAG: T9SS type A sorting domain-containing protein [Bacteroidetes bacterium]|nr:MAG: T9SS type A sorting domain-containing protein [Bacteroidota bacterium]